jgi:uncharacterized protein (DUF885 family)
MSKTPISLTRLFREYWDAYMRFDPVSATTFGDHRFDDELGGADEPHYTDWLFQLKKFRAQLNEIDSTKLSAVDRVNYNTFACILDSEITALSLRTYHLPISKTDGFHTFLPGLYQLMSFEKVSDYENYLSRLEKIRKYFDESIELMRLGLRMGFLPPRVTLEGVAQSILTQVVEDSAQSPFYEPLRNFPASISRMDQERLIHAGRAAIKGSVIPAYEALLKFINEEYYPVSRESISAAELPNGHEYYLSRITYYTTLDLSPEEIHNTGQNEAHKIRREMEDVIRQTGFSGNFEDFSNFLRTNPRFYATTPEALLKEISYLMKRIDGELPRLFKTLPRSPFSIRTAPAFSAPGATTAYYVQGAGDGKNAGVYYVNTSNLKSHPLYEIEALSLHEAVPGHHLQLSLQQELPDLPEFRRFYWFTSYMEGWAVYSERLGLEMGFYTDAYSNFGRLNYEMWRACRLVVDTGIHAFGWTRQRAIKYMADNLSSTLLDIQNEVDRYIAWPGQALAYKIGELKICELRSRAENALGDNFNIREFHEVILLSGSLPLKVLEARVDEWIKSQYKAD